MLTPDQMDAAGEEVAAVYRQIEAELIDWLVQRMVEGDVAGQRAGTALNLLAQSDPEQLRRIIDAHSEEIDDAARRDVERSLAASDAFDLAAIAAGMAVSAPREALTAQTVAVMSSVRGMIARDNLEMTGAARTKFLQWSTWAATQTATGNMTADKAMRRAVRELARGGLSIESVTYRDPESGKVTVTNKADVAVQRHIRSLIGQGAAALTFERMRENGVEFVEVSSHIGSRPSHAEWQGRCYHVGGAVEVDGVRFEDFAFGTGYRGECGPYAALGDQLMGVNCRHSFAPWVPGAPRAYSPDPESPTGLPNEEIYELTQGQRARERKIREAKRELAAMQRVYDADPTPENAAELDKSKALLRSRQERMRAYIAEANARCKPGTKVLKRMPSREWAGDMPKAKAMTKTRALGPSMAPANMGPVVKTEQYSAPTTEQAEAVAMKSGVHFAYYSDMPLEVANTINRAISTLPESMRPRSVTSAKTLQTALGRKFGSGRSFHGVTINDMANFYRVTRNRADLDMEIGWRVGINISKGQSLASIAKKKAAFNARYKRETGSTWYFNESGESVPFHEMGHVYARQAGLPAGFEEDARRWAAESRCAMVKDPHEAWAEAWGAYHTGNKELPEYIARHIEEATASKAAKARKGSGSFDGIGSLDPIRLPSDEWAHVQSEIRTHLNEEQKKQAIVTKAIGDFYYTFENNWPDDAIIIAKRPIDDDWSR